MYSEISSKWRLCTYRCYLDSVMDVLNLNSVMDYIIAYYTKNDYESIDDRSAITYRWS